LSLKSRAEFPASPRPRENIFPPLPLPLLLLLLLPLLLLLLLLLLFQ
jgi:hypothetical protein